MAFKRKKIVRQQWRPNWLLCILYGIWRVAFAAFKIALGAVSTVLIICGVCAFVFVGILGDYLQNDILPNAGMDLEDTTLDQSSTVYYIDDEGQIQVLQQIYASTSRQWASYEDIPAHTIHAAIAIEDKRFYEHQGVDWFTTIKACARMFFGDSSVGGSSITQQLIKNIKLAEADETADDVTVQRKVLEIFRAVQLEKNYDKEEIMEWYLNTIYLGQGCGGVRSAAATYFGKELEKLTIAESAALISITNNPSLFDPYSDNVFTYKGELMDGKQRNRNRQLLVLEEMLTQGWITEEEYEEAVDQELVLKNGIDALDRLVKCPNENCNHKDTAASFTLDGSARYCPVCGTQTPIEVDSSQAVYSWYVESALEDVAQALAEKDGIQWGSDAVEAIYMEKIRKGGYHIYTCIDMNVQKAVDEIYTNLDMIPDTRSGQQLESAIVIIDNATGDLVALSGGVGEKQDFDAYNRATQAKLQSGSAFKPIAVYGPAFEMGAITPATVVKDLPFKYEDDRSPWPYNDNRKFSYTRSVYSAVTSSVNAAAVYTLDKIGTDVGYDFAKDMFGISTLTDYYEAGNGQIWNDYGYAQLALGAQTIGVTVRDMTNAYAVYANKGVWREARTFTRVYDSAGNVVLENPQETRQVVSEKTVNYMNYCLTNVVNSGTGYPAKYDFWETQIAGKTGSTSSFRDRWFCAFTGYYTAAVWTGYNTPEVITVTDGSGSNPAITLWRRVMEPLHDDVDWISLYDKSKFREIEICLDSGLLATDACKADVRVDEKGEFTRVEKVSVYREDMIKDKCTKHVEVEYCTTGGGVATEYCKHFAEVATQVPVPQTTDPVPPVVTEEIKIEKKGLLKVTQMELDELIKAKKFGLYEQFLLDDYVYLTKKNGTDEEFKGIDGKLDQSKTEEKEPYKICQLHTKEAWETYQQQMQPPPEQTVPDTTDPNAPETTDPNAPETTDPNAPGTTNPNVPDATQPSTPDPNTPVIPGSAGTQTQ